MASDASAILEIFAALIASDNITNVCRNYTYQCVHVLLFCGDTGALSQNGVWGAAVRRLNLL